MGVGIFNYFVYNDDRNRPPFESARQPSSSCTASGQPSPRAGDWPSTPLLPRVVFLYLQPHLVSGSNLISKFDLVKTRNTMVKNEQHSFVCSVKMFRSFRKYVVVNLSRILPTYFLGNIKL